MTLHILSLDHVVKTQASYNLIDWCLLMFIKKDIQGSNPPPQLSNYQ
jgi:hypothetical protein